MKKPSIYIGLMSGTSIDSIDAVAVRFPEHSEQKQQHSIEILETESVEIPPLLKQRVIELNTPSPNEIDKMMALDIELGQLFADAVMALLKKANISNNEVKAIGNHGQTIRHQTDAPPYYTLQIANANVIAQKTGICTVADFRTRDMVVGGQGAPLVPAFHEYMFASEQNRVIINIGGMANVSFLWTHQEIQGFDTGPGNVLMDAWIQHKQNKAYDENGAWARTGRIDGKLLERFLQEPYFAKPTPKSTGRDLFDWHWLEHYLGKQNKQKAEDIQATLLALTSESIAQAIENWGPAPCDIFVCGGGSQNEFLMESLAQRLANYQIASTESLGLLPGWVEGCAFAWLAKRCLEAKPSNLPSVTGAQSPVILGNIFPV